LFGLVEIAQGRFPIFFQFGCHQSVVRLLCAAAHKIPYVALTVMWRRTLPRP
jgi:hypothetical protein